MSSAVSRWRRSRWSRCWFARPFTLAYAKDTTPREHWDSPLFLRINYVISAVWAGAFLFSAIVGAYGDAVLRDNDNFWTAWILPLAATIFAVSFTEFYPDYATRARMRPSLDARIFDWLPPFIMVTGIVGWVSDAVPDAVGIALIAVGVVGSAAMRKVLPRPRRKLLRGSEIARRRDPRARVPSGREP